MLALSMASGVGPATFHRLMAAFGSAEAVFAASAAELTAVCPGLKTETLKAIQDGPNLRAVRFQEEACQRLRARIVCERSEAYPDPLRTLPQPPPFLFMAGEWRPEDRRAMAVVGTRFPSPYGSRMAREMALGLSEQGFTIVSGLARGIDTLAHKTALHCGARTLAVLGSALDWIYPSENSNLARDIARKGALISEFPMGMAPHATHFPRRNRLISALSLGTLVVEAGNDSGALITADFALDQGREVFAVPGAVHEPGSCGTHKLIREGAHLVERAADIVAVLQGTSQAVPARRFQTIAPITALLDEAGPFPDSPDLFSPEPAASGVAVEALPGPMHADAAVVPTGWINAPYPDATTASTALEAAAAGLDEEARSLLSLLGREAQTLDAIAEKARRKARLQDAKPHRLLTGLLELELKGRVKRMPGALFRLT
ncbi:MAG: DNA-protecting protein DprA [Fibrobacteres bacterium]|nr:DNA-protecting protein DprA [Fibrobacterota bacterium]